MTGFLIPEWYHSEAPAETDMNVASIIWGFSLCVAMFSAAMAAQQTYEAYTRGRMFTGYIIMCWMEWIGSTMMGIITWIWLFGVVEASFWVFFFIILFWSIQINMVLQIIINRIALLEHTQHRVNKLKWIVAAIIVSINLSGFCIWIPARMQITPTYERINIFWDRAEKGVFLVVDFGLNIFFLRLIRTRLIANGLTKYEKLFYANICTTVLSLILDIVLMGATFLPSPVVYVQFHTLVYLSKLYIEMSVATLISKIVQGSRRNGGAGGPQSRATHSDKPARRRGSIGIITTVSAHHKNGPGIKIKDSESTNSILEDDFRSDRT